jgi:hypothetical protein
LALVPKPINLGATEKRRRPNMRRLIVASGAIALALTVSGALAFAGISSGSTTGVPTKDVVGVGIFNCAVVTGEVGFSPSEVTGGTATETTSIWFQATKCAAASGTTATPVPTTVVGSISFTSTQGNACPQLGSLGTGTLNLSYNFPPVPGKMIDPSVASSVSVTQSGAFWDLAGAVGWGSYPSPSFTAQLKPVVIGTQTCANGLTSEYINRGTLSNV